MHKFEEGNRPLGSMKGGDTMGGLNLNALIHSASKQLGMTPEALKKALDSEIYVDKTEMIAYLNTKVAQLLEWFHDTAENKTYNSEVALSYAVQMAYYAAQKYYTTVQELDTGKGYADLAFIPKKPDIPAMLVELKYDKNADTAIEQIHRQKYPERLAHYKGNLIFVGINYDEQSKSHECRIERFEI